MSSIRELSFDEIALVSGGGANGQDNNERSNYGGNSARTGYGGQANGFQPNYAAGAAGANMYNDITSNCGIGIAGGLMGLGASVASRSIAGAGSAVAGMIGSCKR
ncbi:hypothetical protein OH773_10710 [Buttiauxella sp. WJP83]|uniref:hypothetical protein n=1 Tax=Buttiauxella sp. WJP83 TaxID=2986951 RepID=UPI0022DE0A9D|nr:hypothetical protein [Buttiauxella sp. WJP83]WBM72670.1 hypothetical protein OH773_10710 [Buttiauxella sp. WJP83]